MRMLRDRAGSWWIAGSTWVLAAACVHRPPALPPASDVATGNSSTVAVGYATRPPRQLTSAVGSVSVKPREAGHYARIEEMLAGRVAGLEVRRRSDGRFMLRIRGVTSIVGNSEPLLVLDDMPIAEGAMDVLASLAPSDVERVDVLKDAGAAAIYGSRGANGVILITTKRTR